MLINLLLKKYNYLFSLSPIDGFQKTQINPNLLILASSLNLKLDLFNLHIFLNQN